MNLEYVSLCFCGCDNLCRRDGGGNLHARHALRHLGRPVLARQALSDGEDRVDNDGVDAGGDLRIHILRRVVHRPIAHTHQPALLHHPDQAGAEDEGLARRDDAEEVPPRGEADRLLQRGRSDVTHVGSPGLCQEETRYRRLLESQEQANVWMKGTEDDVSSLTVVVDTIQYGIH